MSMSKSDYLQTQQRIGNIVQAVRELDLDGFIERGEALKVSALVNSPLDKDQTQRARDAIDTMISYAKALQTLRETIHHITDAAKALASLVIPRN